MPDNLLRDAAERLRKKAVASDSQRDEMKKRTEMVRKLYELWGLIYEGKLTDGENRVNSAALGDWIIGYNARIEAFLDCLNETEYSQFLPFLPSRNDAETICVELLKQKAKIRLKTLRELTLPNGEINWHLPFNISFLLDGLLSWQLWMDAKTWDQRHQVYLLNSFHVGTLGFEDGHKATAYALCAEQWQRLSNDPERPESKMPPRSDYDPNEDDVSEPSDGFSEEQENEFDPVKVAKAEILAYWLLNETPYSVKQWFDAGCPLETIPSIDSPAFLQLVKELRFQVDLAEKNPGGTMTGDQNSPKRPETTRPKRATPASDWWLYDDAIYALAQGEQFGAGKCWTQYESKLKKAGVKNSAEFKAIHHRLRGRQKNR